MTFLGRRIQGVLLNLGETEGVFSPVFGWKILAACNKTWLKFPPMNLDVFLFGDLFVGSYHGKNHHFAPPPFVGICFGTFLKH